MIVAEKHTQLLAYTRHCKLTLSVQTHARSLHKKINLFHKLKHKHQILSDFGRASLTVQEEDYLLQLSDPCQVSVFTQLYYSHEIVVCLCDFMCERKD